MQEVEMKPRISLDAKTLPAVKNWKVGGKYTIHLKVKQVGAHADDYGHRAEFEVISAKDGSSKKDFPEEAIKQAKEY